MNQRTRQDAPATHPPRTEPLDSADSTVRVNGLEQVIELLRHADPSFRNSLLKRLQARDPALAQRLLRIIR
ncbi:MAG: hypothetical protein KGP28_00455 [Bdellovibrionales bacterium]|nr:hypothetical protein [Bdellovibrionales bacterium]